METGVKAQWRHGFFSTGGWGRKSPFPQGNPPPPAVHSLSTWNPQMVWKRKREEGKPIKAFPLGGRYPSAHTGGDEGAIMREVSGRRPLIRHGLYRPCHLPPKGKAGQLPVIYAR